MSREIRRPHRQQTQFTNFSSSPTVETPNPKELVKQNIEENSNQPIKRRRRRRGDDSDDFNDISSPPGSTQSISQNNEKSSQDIPLVSNAPLTFSINDVNAIRAEFQEDAYYLKLAESDFSDDTHDWGGDSQLPSDDYWHFVGSFE